MSVSEILGQGSIVFAVGMTVVFVILTLLIFMINVTSRILSISESKKKSESLTKSTDIEPNQPAFNADEMTDELIAVITAAVLACMNKSRSSSEIYVRSIRRTGTTSPAWNIAGRNDYLATRL